MTTEKLREILDKHKKWLNNEEGFKHADLSGADLRGADLSEADLSGANLCRADLRGADLSNANLHGADLRNANLHGADLRNANLHGADLRHAGLRFADLFNADLFNSDLSNADLSYADLRHADLFNAGLRFANLYNADLRGANLDYSALPLWCGSLKTHFDDKQIIQFVYHTVKAGLYSKNVSPEIKEKLKKLAPLANKFHRAEECGKISTENNNREVKALDKLKQALFEQAHKCRKLAEKNFNEADECDWELNRNARLQGARYMEGIADAVEYVIIDCDLEDEFIDYKRARDEDIEVNKG
jgi:hypothetical protein